MPPRSDVTCAYPRCRSHDRSDSPSRVPLSNDNEVQLCSVCGIVQIACRERDCGALNRSFIGFCRRCGKELPAASPRSGEPTAWYQFRQSRANEIPTGISEPKLLAEIPVPTERGPYPARIMLAMFEGLIAVHDPGNFRGLCRPFSDNPDDGWVWNNEESNDVSDVPLRAFAPVILEDRRHIVFSTPKYVSVLDLWSCSELSACGSEVREVHLDLAARRAELLTSPIPLGGGMFGLLIDARGPRWIVWNTSAGDRDLYWVDEALQENALKISGRRCHAVALEGLVLTFSTSDGHWVWKREDAASGKLGSIRNTWGADQSEYRIPVPNDERDYTPPAQAFSTRNLQKGSKNPRFEWYFRAVSETQRDVPKVLSYEVFLEDLKRSDPEVFSERDSKPWTFLDGQLLCEGDHATLFQQARPGDSRTKQYTGVVVEGMVSFVIQGHLLIMQGTRRSETGAPGEVAQRFLRVCSLTDDTRPVDKNLGLVRSEPLSWSRWIFTAEVIDGACGLWRRDLQFQSDPPRLRFHRSEPV